MPKGHLSFALIGKGLKHYRDKLVKPQIAPSQGQQTQNTFKAHRQSTSSYQSIDIFLAILFRCIMGENQRETVWLYRKIRKIECQEKRTSDSILPQIHCVTLDKSLLFVWLHCLHLQNETVEFNNLFHFSQL